MTEEQDGTRLHGHVCLNICLADCPMIALGAALAEQDRLLLHSG